MNDKKIILRLFHVFRRYCETAALEAKTVTKDEPKRSRLRELPGKIRKYFYNIYNDYKMVAIEAFQDAKQRPVRTVAMTTGIGALSVCVYNNPSESVFRQQLINSANELQLVGDKIRSPISDEHVRKLIELRNAGRLRCLSLGAFSVMWTDNFDPEVDIYEAHCSYVSVGWTELPRKIVDIGFWNRWWLLHKAMENYDINPHEWNEELPKRLVDFDALK